MLRFYNTLTRRKENFEPLEKGRVRLYTCGPTVWDFAHIGNFRAFVFADVLKRYLRYRGFDVFHVLNITDVEDKILRRLREEGGSLAELTGEYTKRFLSELSLLNVIDADVYPRATEHVAEMIELICVLMDKGVAYERQGSVYFSIKKFPDYGKFARLDMAGMQDGISVDTDEYEKEGARDFALWKAWSEDDGEIYWDSPFGIGRPGWHIECSAMSMKYLGRTFDIHTGGVDLIFPHHQNEIAQSEAATDANFVNCWMHNEFVNIDNEKMSKSTGNVYQLCDIVRQPLDYRAYRYLLVAHHYRRRMNFSFEQLDWARTNLQRLDRLLDQLTKVDGRDSSLDWKAEVDRSKVLFQEHMDDDLNLPAAIGTIFGLVGEAERAVNAGFVTRKNADLLTSFFSEINQVLGIFYEVENVEESPRVLPEALRQLLEEREEARSRKDWRQADELRDCLQAAGIEVKDGTDGYEWSWNQGQPNNERPK